ncbi:MAG: Hint domain-containing protein, partial [Microgenomates group bacterium]
NYTVSSNCSFGGATDGGVDGGDLIINTNITLTITSGQYITWNSGKKVTLASGSSIQNSGGSLIQGSLWVKDSDADLYGEPATTGTENPAKVYRDSNKPVGAVRVTTLTSRSSGDCNDANAASHVCYAYSQSNYYAYSQSNYYGYGQGSYYSYGQGTYYGYGQGGYYGYGQSYYSSCFLGGTQVLMANGTSKNIEDIKPGDIVLSYDLQNGRTTWQVVVQLLTHKDVDGGYLVINDDLKVTGNHRMWSPSESEWVTADSLKVGDTLLDQSGKNVTVNSIEAVEGTNTVYNLTLPGPTHTYFADGVLVHNEKVGSITR